MDIRDIYNLLSQDPTSEITDASQLIGATVLYYHYAHRLVATKPNEYPSPTIEYDSEGRNIIGRSEYPKKFNKRYYGNHSIKFLGTAFDKIQNSLEHADISKGYTTGYDAVRRDNYLSWYCNQPHDYAQTDDNTGEVTMYFCNEMRPVLPACATTFAIGACYLLTPVIAPRTRTKTANEPFRKLRNAIKHAGDNPGTLIADSTTIAWTDQITPVLPTNIRNIRRKETAQDLINILLQSLPEAEIMAVLDKTSFNVLKTLGNANLKPFPLYWFEYPHHVRNTGIPPHSSPRQPKTNKRGRVNE